MADRSPRHAPRRTRRSWGQRILLGFGVAVSVFALLGSGFVVWAYAEFGSITRFAEDEVAVDGAAAGEPANYLIVGSDSREDVDVADPAFADVLPGEVDGARSDTIMVARVDPETAEVQMVSFPRDLLLPLANGTTDRINAAYGYGRQVLIDTIQQNFGMTINHYLEIDFTGFQRLVNAIDGIPVFLDAAYRDERAGLTEPIGPGCVTLSGADALSFARSRSLQRQDDDGDWDTDPTADLGRITRQQFLIRRAVERTLSLNPFTNPLTLTRLLDVTTDSVAVDAGLSNDDLRGLANQFQGFDPDAIVNHALPVRDRRTSAGAAVLELVEGPELEAILNVFRGLPPGAVAPTEVRVVVRNGSGTDRQGADTAEALAALGFAAAVDGDAEPAAATTVFHATGSEYAAQLVARHLTSRAQFVVDDDLDGNEVFLVTGPDFTTVVRQPWSEADVPLPTTTTAPPTTVPAEDGPTTTVEEEPVTTTTTEPPIGFLPEEPPDAAC